MAKAIKPKTPLNNELIQDLLNRGLTKIMINNFIKKGKCYEDILPKVKGKVEDIEAREWLKNRLGKDMKMPKRSLPIIKDWKLINKKQEFVITFPLLPSVNHMYMNTSFGSKQLTNSAKKLFIELQDMIEQELLLQEWQPTYKTKVIMELNFFLDDNRKKDTHNMLKILCDSFNGIAFDDDYWLLPNIINFEVEPNNPRIEIKLKIKE